MNVKDMKCCACGEMAKSRYKGKPYCNRHYQLAIRYGVPENNPRKRVSQYIVDGDILIVVTSKGDEIIADAEELEKISKYSWCISKTGYAVANIKGKVTKLHRYILGINDPSIQVDHINRNKLDNRKANIRTCTAKENLRNRGVRPNSKSGHLGIRKTPGGRFEVRIVADRKEIHIGNFATLEEAKKARNNAEDKYHLEFASHRAEEIS